MFTPYDQRHVLLDVERQDWEAAMTEGPPPAGWRPLGDSGLWWGPGLTVAERTHTGWALHEGDAARSRLLTHAFRAPEPQRSHVADVGPPGIPMDDAVRAMALALPGWAIVEASSTGALFARLPDALAFCDGKHGQLEFAGWWEGERAMDIAFQYGLTRSRSAAGTHAAPAADATAGATGVVATRGAANGAAKGTSAGITDGTATPAAAPPAGAPNSNPVSSSSVGGAFPPVRVALAFTEGQRLVRALGLGAVVVFVGPVLAAPLLLAGAIGWMIGTLAIWTAAIPLLRGWLSRAEARAPRPLLEVDGPTLRVPAERGGYRVDLTAARVQRAWFRPVYGRMEAGGTRPAFARWQLTSDDVELILAASDLPRPNGFPEGGPLPDSRAVYLEVPPSEFGRLSEALTPWVTGPDGQTGVRAPE